VAGILGVTNRNFTGRVFGGDGMRIGGTFHGPAAEVGGRPLIADWECLGVSSGGWLFLGLELGPAAGNNARAAANNIRRIADVLGRTLTDKSMKKELADKLAYQSKAASQSPLRGETRNQRRGWRQKADWDASDLTDEIASFVASSERKDRRGVDAIWVTNSVFQTNQKLLPLLDLSDGLIRKWGFGGENRLQVGAGTMLDLAPLERFRGKDVYVLALTFNTALSEAPHLWHADDVRGSLTISRADHSAVAVAPLEVLQGPPDPYALGLVHVQRGFANIELRCAALHPVIAVFSTSLPDGSPLIRGPGDVLELHTVMDGRKVILTFKLAHLDLKSVDDLKIQ
jgi:hypothetical protein